VRIEESIKELPAGDSNDKMHARDRADKVADSLRKLAPGDWLPVVFENKRQAYLLRQSFTSRTNRGTFPKIDSRLRDLTMYIRIRPSA